MNNQTINEIYKRDLDKVFFSFSIMEMTILKKELFIPLLVVTLMVLESILLLFSRMIFLNLRTGIIFFFL